MKKVDKIITEYKKTRTETIRKRYPKIDLHPNFEKILGLQINKLRENGMTNKEIVDRLQRAIPFYVYEEE